MVKKELTPEQLKLFKQVTGTEDMKLEDKLVLAIAPVIAARNYCDATDVAQISWHIVNEIMKERYTHLGE